MNFKRKRLNNKGFTLIELLAVVVILALLMSISVTSVLNAMNNSRLSTIHSQSKAIVEWYNTTVAQDDLGIGDKVIPTDAVTAVNDGNWHCLNNVGGKDLADLYNLSTTDFILSGDSISEPSPDENDSFTVTDATCSAIRVDGNGRVEVLLVASKDGKFNVGGNNITYALSSAAEACTGAGKCKN